MKIALRAGGAPVVSFAGLTVFVALACGPVTSPAPFSAPMNACPAHACASYVQAGTAPSCVDGACIVPPTLEDLVMVVSLPDDAYLVPGGTYVVLLGAGASAASSSWPCPPPTCVPPVCRLPGYVVDSGSYQIAPSATLGLWNLGNPGYTALPMRATYRFLWGPSTMEASSLGLPVPVVAASLTTPNGVPGPGGAVGLGFQAYLQPGCYERTLQPDAPFSRALPPNVKVLQDPLPVGVKPLGEQTEFFDSTREEPELQSTKLPTFIIARAAGLDGWTAYLRDTTTLRTVSNVAPMKGASSQVVLPTNHVQPVAAGAMAPDPLVGLALVVAPPAGAPIPTEVLVPTANILPEHESYPSLPPPVTMTGRVIGARRAGIDGGTGGAAVDVDADVVFTATDVVDARGTAYPPNFEFTARVRTSVDPRTGASIYAVTLPLGDYQVVVQPLDAASAMYVGPMAVRASSQGSATHDFSLAPLTVVTGKAVVADGRPLAQADVEALPTQCPATSSTQSLTQPTPVTAADTTGSCLPRAVHGFTADDGSFALALDPGEYRLRVRPADGSRLPWFHQAIVVGSAAQTVGILHVPAPVSVGMQLTDSVGVGNPIVDAVVSVFSNPSSGSPAIELGQAMTDSMGHYEMYVAPTAP